MTIAVLIHVLGDSLSPRGATLELFMNDIDTSINDVDINTLSPNWIVDILGERREAELVTMAYASQTPGSILLCLQLSGTHNLILLYVGDFGHGPKLVDNITIEATGIAVEVAVIDLLDSSKVVNKWVFCMGVLKEVHMVGNEMNWYFLLEDDDVRVVDGSVRVVLFEERS
jgi:hypothetical protein